MHSISRLYHCLLFSSLLILSCNTPMHTRSAVESAMKHYDHLIRKLDADSIALLYTPDGMLGEMARGRDSIRKFLSSFKNVQVLSQVSTTNLIEIIHDTAIQKGNYSQTDVISNKDTVRVKGEFTARWILMGKQGWHIKRMDTKPSN